MATHVTFTHAEAVFPLVPAGDSQLFNVQASMELLTGVLPFRTCQAVCSPKCHILVGVESYQTMPHWLHDVAILFLWSQK